MNLPDFIKQTFMEISKGIQEAQAEQKKPSIMRVNPDFSPYSRDSTGVLGVTGGGANVHAIHFDVAISVSEGTGKSGEAGLVVGPIKIGGKANHESSEGFVSRISFAVPVTFPRA